MQYSCGFTGRGYLPIQYLNFPLLISFYVKSCSTKVVQFQGAATSFGCRYRQHFRLCKAPLTKVFSFSSSEIIENFNTFVLLLYPENNVFH